MWVYYSFNSTWSPCDLSREAKRCVQCEQILQLGPRSPVSEREKKLCAIFDGVRPELQILLGIWHDLILSLTCTDKSTDTYVVSLHNMFFFFNMTTANCNLDHLFCQ